MEDREEVRQEEEKNETSRDKRRKRDNRYLDTRRQEKKEGEDCGERHLDTRKDKVNKRKRGGYKGRQVKGELSGG